MVDRKQYWDQDALDGRIKLEFRASIALGLIESFGSVAGKLSDGEDSTGRKNLTLQDPQELVTRCFAIADAFVDAAEQRGELVEPLSFEERHTRIGEAKHLQMKAEFKREKEASSV